MQLKRVVVTGLGALTPIGNNIEEYWNALINGVSGAAPITRFDAAKFKTRFACELKDFTVTDFINRKDARKMDKFAQYAMVASDEAIADSGLDLDKINKLRVGVIWGAGIGGIETFQNEAINFGAGDGTPRFNPFFIPKMIADIAPGNISIKNGFMGPNYTTVSACASSANAMIDALNYIRLNHCDVIVTGGSEAAITQAGVGGFNAMKALSERNDDYRTASRPFDAERDGFVLGEGAGAIILEEYEHAKARGAKIYGEIVGHCANSDGHDMVAPSGEGAIRCMQQALTRTNQKVDYINAHGTSTPVGDMQELHAVREVFKDKGYLPKLTSTKSLTGHSLGATGVQEAIYTLLMMNNNFISGSANINNDDPEIGSIDIPRKTIQNIDINLALSNSFGFGGTNACLALSKFN